MFSFDEFMNYLNIIIILARLCLIIKQWIDDKNIKKGTHHNKKKNHKKTKKRMRK